jgi:hypothetical protein
MKIQNLLLATIGMFSSALVWANTYTTAGHALAMDYSEGWVNVNDVPVKETLQNIMLQKDEGQPIGGYLNYRIQVDIEGADHHAGYDFQIQFTENSQCKIDGTDSKTLNGDGIGPYAYNVSVSQGTVDGIAKCDVTIEDTTPIVRSYSYQDLNIGQYACNDSNNNGAVNVEVSNVKPFIIGTDNYLAVLVKDYSGSCNDGRVKEVRGVHFFKWEKSNSSGKVGFEHKQSVTTANGLSGMTAPSAIEFFDSGSSKHFIIGQYADEKYDTSKSKVYQFNFNDGIIDTSSKKDISQCSGNYCGTQDLKVIPGNGGGYYLLTVNGGSRMGSYKKYTTLQKWDSSAGQFGAVEANSPVTAGAIAGTYFDINGDKFVYIARKNSATSLTTMSKLYKIDTNHPNNKMIYQNELQTYNLHGIEHFNIKDKDYFLLANSTTENTSKANHLLHEWNGTNIQPIAGSQHVNISNLKGWKHIQIYGKDYLLAIHPDNTLSLLYQLCEGQEGICQAQIQMGEENMGGYELNGAPGVSWEKASLKATGETESRDYLFRFDKYNKHTIGVKVIKLELE